VVVVIGILVMMIGNGRRESTEKQSSKIQLLIHSLLIPSFFGSSRATAYLPTNETNDNKDLYM
jgi:hypothetical protein